MISPIMAARTGTLLFGSSVGGGNGRSHLFFYIVLVAADIARKAQPNLRSTSPVTPFWHRDFRSRGLRSHQFPTEWVGSLSRDVGRKPLWSGQDYGNSHSAEGQSLRALERVHIHDFFFPQCDPWHSHSRMCLLSIFVLLSSEKFLHLFCARMSPVSV